VLHIQYAQSLGATPSALDHDLQERMADLAMLLNTPSKTLFVLKKVGRFNRAPVLNTRPWLLHVFSFVLHSMDNQHMKLAIHLLNPAIFSLAQSGTSCSWILASICTKRRIRQASPVGQQRRLKVLFLAHKSVIFFLPGLTSETTTPCPGNSLTKPIISESIQCGAEWVFLLAFSCSHNKFSEEMSLPPMHASTIFFPNKLCTPVSLNCTFNTPSS